jgi:hypothetical protein
VVCLPQSIRQRPATDGFQLGHVLSQPPVRNDVGTGRYCKD